MTLRDALNNVLAAVITDGSGAFSFSGLGSGTYTLTATPPPGLVSTNAFPGQGGTRLGPATLQVTTTPGITSYPGQLFLAGP